MERWLWGGVEFRGKTNGAELVDQYVILDKGVKGWDANVSVRRAKVSRSWGHGSFESAAMYNDRVITLTGVVQASSPSLLPHFLESLAGLPLGYGWLTVVEHDDSRRVWAGLESVKCDRVNGWQDKARFQLTFWCPDPWKFGDTRSFKVQGSGSASVWHMGTVDAAPTFTVAGPWTGSTLTLSMDGRDMRVLGAIPKGETLTVDMRESTIRDKSGKSLPARLFGRPLVVPPARETTLRVAGTGTGSVVMRVDDTYV